MLDDASQTRIARYVAGEIEGAEADVVRRWIGADAERAAYATALQQLWAAAERPSDFDPQVGWAAVRARLAAHDAADAAGQAGLRVVAGRVPGTRARPDRRILGAAAAAAVLAVAVWSRRSATPAARHDTPATAVAPRAAGPGPLRTVATAPARRADVYLSDGSHVVLGAGSRLRFAAPLAPTVRDVYLDGEAFFEVAHDSAAPFIVHAGRATTRVLGTRFAVRAFPRDSSVEVVVRDGRVLLTPAAGGAAGVTGEVLTRGVRGRLAPSGRILVERGVDVNAALAWSEGRLVFRRAPLAVVLRDLGDWYGLEVRVADAALARRPVTATFDEQPVERVLDAVAVLANAQYVREGDRVLFAPVRAR